jgi:hypothetical protein
MVGAISSAMQERAMTREPSSGSTSAASSKSEIVTTVLGTRCFSGITGSHGFARFCGRYPSQGA